MGDEESTKKEIYCPKCGRKNRADARFCSYCGTPMPRIMKESNGESDYVGPAPTFYKRNTSKQPLFASNNRMPSSSRRKIVITIIICISIFLSLFGKIIGQNDILMNWQQKMNSFSDRMEIDDDFWDKNQIFLNVNTLFQYTEKFLTINSYNSIEMGKFDASLSKDMKIGSEDIKLGDASDVSTIPLSGIWVCMQRIGATVEQSLKINIGLCFFIIVIFAIAVYFLWKTNNAVKQRGILSGIAVAELIFILGQLTTIHMINEGFRKIFLFVTVVEKKRFDISQSGSSTLYPTFILFLPLVLLGITIVTDVFIAHHIKAKKYHS